MSGILVKYKSFPVCSYQFVIICVNVLSRTDGFLVYSRHQDTLECSFNFRFIQISPKFAQKIRLKYLTLKPETEKWLFAAYAAEITEFS